MVMPTTSDLAHVQEWSMLLLGVAAAIYATSWVLTQSLLIGYRVIRRQVRRYRVRRQIRTEFAQRRSLDAAMRIR